jgi:hypothetical protein
VHGITAPSRPIGTQLPFLDDPGADIQAMFPYDRVRCSDRQVAAVEFKTNIKKLIAVRRFEIT